LEALILFSTVFLAVTFGIIAAYGLVITFLHAFAYQARIADTQPALGAKAQAAHAGGD
jgi:hypothetical protein